MRTNRVFASVLALGLVAVLVTSAYGWDRYKYSLPEQNLVPIPDADKPGVANGQLPPGNDMSCWQAAAANLLAASGWGNTQVNQTPQQNANAIYGHLTQHFSVLNCGSCELAVNWWLYNYGYNPNAPDTNYYDPQGTYNDVTVIHYGGAGIPPGAGMGQNNAYGSYDWLLDELFRCQYVAVKWEIPQVGYHCITLVGGDYCLNGQFRGQSVWHDSDRDWVGPQPVAPWGDDNAYNNAANQGGGWMLPAYPTAKADKAVLLCPGLQKPQAAIENFDYARFRDQDLAGNPFVTDRTSGANAGEDGYGDVEWEQDTETLIWNLRVPNEEIEDWEKRVYLLIDYTDRDNNADPGITLKLPDETLVTPTKAEYSPDNGQILLTWELDFQPSHEWIIFPSNDYHNLTGDVKDWDVATICVPEPATLMLLAIGGLLAIRRRRR